MLRKQYGVMFDMVQKVTTGFPPRTVPLLRSGTGIASKKVGHIVNAVGEPELRSTNAFYLVHDVPRDQIDRQFAVFQRGMQGSRRVAVPAGSPVRFRFPILAMVRGQTMRFDSLDAVEFWASPERPGTCDISVSVCLRRDGRDLYRRVAGGTLAIGHEGVQRHIFPSPAALLEEGIDVTRPAILEMTLDVPADILVGGAQKPNQSIEIGGELHRDMALVCTVAGRLVDTRPYTQMEQLGPSALIFGRTDILRALDIRPPYGADDYLKIGRSITRAEPGK